MYVRNISGRPPSGPWVPYYRLQPYPTPGNPIYEVVRIKGVSPLNRPGHGVSPLNRPEHGLYPLNRPDQGRKAFPDYNSGRRAPHLNRSYRRQGRDTSALRHYSADPGTPSHLERGISPLNRIQRLTEQERSPVEYDLSDLVPLDMTLSKPVKTIVVVKTSPQVQRSQVDSAAVVSPASNVREGDFVHHQKQRFDDDVSDDSDREDWIPPPLMPPAHSRGRRSQLTRARQEVEVYLVTSLAGLTLNSPRGGSHATAGGDGQGCLNLDLMARKVKLLESDLQQEQPLDLSRKRKRDKLVITISGKQRRVDTSPSKDLESGDCRWDEVSLGLTSQSTGACMKDVCDGDVVMGRVRRRAWRRKPGSVSLTTPSHPRRLISRLDETPLDLSGGHL